ncbi:hypothetical protein [Archangium lansingense]|uniref:Lipoprotein n=1 Tax=Archangium lansingense TaxID=2995310 RepID=A0ABT4A2J4_9BACT|nr:hypothetical protein [Archangium lansinium]MCY1075871.1 hypothetical protein [Archangium lansinium]
MHRMLLIAVVAVLGTGCGGAEMDDSTDLSSEELGTSSSELAALELNEASASVSYSYDIVNFVYDPNMFPGEVGRGGYQRDGDKIGMADSYGDGMRIGVHWRLGDGSRRGLCYWTGGAGTHGGCNKDFPEGKRFEFRVGRCNGSKYSCGDPAQSGSGWQNWSDWSSTGT